MSHENRVKWAQAKAMQTGSGQLHVLIGDRRGEGWAFAERSTWEVRWHDIPVTPELIAKAQNEDGGQGVPPQSGQGVSIGVEQAAHDGPSSGSNGRHRTSAQPVVSAMLEDSQDIR